MAEVANEDSIHGILGSKKGRGRCKRTSKCASASASKKGRTETSESEIEIETVGDEYEPEKRRTFSAEEMVQFRKELEIFWAQRKTSRYQQKYEEYFRRTQGFDLPTDDEDSLSESDRPCCQMIKCDDSDLAVNGDARKAAIWALQEHNRLNNTNLELVQPLKANFELVSGIIYYVTFVAKDNVTCQHNTYQAKVYEPFSGDNELMIFRLAPSVLDAQGDKKVA